MEPDDDETSNFEPTKVPKKIDVGNEKAIDIASGHDHVVILTENGNVYTFGVGEFGQLGRIERKDLDSVLENRELFLKPGLVMFERLEESEKLTKVFAGNHSSYAITSYGNLYSWGLNDYNQLGLENTHTGLGVLVPVKVPLNFKVKQVASGVQHLLLLDEESNVYSCGFACWGLLGLSEITSNEIRTIETPQLIERERFDGQEIQAIACGYYLSLALTTNGTVFGWGKWGQLGGDDEFVFCPTKFVGPVVEAYKVSQISAGAFFAVFAGKR